MIKKHSLVLQPGARNDTQDAYDWYENQLAGLGDKFLNALEECYLKIEKHPAAFGKFYKNYRKAVIKKFPYLIIFTIIKNEIFVFAIFHGERNPKKRLKRD